MPKEKEIIDYLRKREQSLFDLMNSLTEGTELYKETRAKHIELLNILKELEIEM